MKDGKPFPPFAIGTPYEASADPMAGIFPIS